MEYRISFTGKFRKDFKRCIKRNYKISLLEEAMLFLRNGEVPSKYLPHKLSGNYEGRWECHIKPDWLLIWKHDDDQKNDNSGENRGHIVIFFSFLQHNPTHRLLIIASTAFRLSPHLKNSYFSFHE